jgi:hypothetical protein
MHVLYATVHACDVMWTKTVRETRTIRAYAPLHVVARRIVGSQGLSAWFGCTSTALRLYPHRLNIISKLAYLFPTCALATAS